LTFTGRCLQTDPVIPPASGNFIVRKILNNCTMDIENPEPQYTVFNLEDGEFRTTLTNKYKNRKPYLAPDPKKIYAFIPGTIIKIHVKEKQKVKKGDPLLVFQAMKMNNILMAPINGIIKKINVKTGETVPKTLILIEFK
jgi:biotin carboxyl carrier protein